MEQVNEVKITHGPLAQSTPTTNGAPAFPPEYEQHEERGPGDPNRATWGGKVSTQSMA